MVANDLNAQAKALLAFELQDGNHFTVIEAAEADSEEAGWIPTSLARVKMTRQVLRDGHQTGRLREKCGDSVAHLGASCGIGNYLKPVIREALRDFPLKVTTQLSIEAHLGVSQNQLL